MNEYQKAHLQRLADDERLTEILEQALLSALDDRNPNLSLTNEELGAETRAKAEAKELVKKGLEQIKELKNYKVGKNKSNPAI